MNQLSQRTFFVEAGLLLEAGAFFAGAFLVAALALEVGLAPVIACESQRSELGMVQVKENNSSQSTFFAAPRLDGEVGFLSAGAFLPAKVFLGSAFFAAGFFGAAFAAGALAAGFFAAAALPAAGFFAVLALVAFATLGFAAALVEDFATGLVVFAAGLFYKCGFAT